ncbi:MAG: tRNA (N(6)-L-threonylcarbamoyladenosine(37)-C(2))-methylthiotransferase MtaB [Clostridia bacterium]|nr:tRNA (N(6)-L-threonylcarbamoyladenosine(37)-C(2))-methylthiotransferase MtaB [Clostridia bacterium]
MKVAFATLGCRVNQYDTAAMRARLEAQGFTIVPFSQPADAYVINSCTVTGESDRKARQLIGRARRLNPQAILCVTGCYAQRDPKTVLDLDGVDIVLGTGTRNQLGDLLKAAVKGEKRNAVSPFAGTQAYEETFGTSFDRVRAFVKIQDGCDRHCTYCAIPAARGPVRSRALSSIVRECTALAQAGFCEAELTGIRLAAYGQEQGLVLMDAVEAAAETGLSRIRLGSLDPDALGPGFAPRAADCKPLCRHFHLSLQSGSTSVLRRMARRYTAEDYLSVIEDLRADMPDATFSTDVMVGFPGETEAEFRQTCELVEKAGLMRLHIFPYSPRPGTPAARMDGQITKQAKEERVRVLSQIGARLSQQYALTQVGCCADVLWEQHAEGYLQGHGRDFMVVRAPMDAGRPGKTALVTIGTCKDGVAYTDACQI